MGDQRETALIVGAGAGLSASFARLCAAQGMGVILAARDIRKLDALVAETGAHPVACDATDSAAVARLFEAVDAQTPQLDLVLHNASGRYREKIEAIDPRRLEEAIRATAFGAFLVAQQAAIRMQKQRRGTILLTGATASLKGMPGSTAFAMGKFALRGMAQSFARELAPQNIHVAHAIIDGGIGSAAARPNEGDDRWLDPDAIAAEYMHLHRQHRSAWTWEIEIRPWVEKF